MARSLQIVLFALLMCGCNKNKPSGIGKSAAAKVVGYRFTLPGEGDPNTLIPAVFSLINESGEIDLDLLSKLQVKQAELTPSQRERLVTAVYADHPTTSAAACYEPHHIFIFYDEQDQIINLVEICFGCLNLHTFPDLEKTQWRRHDFRSLAQLCDEIGIGMTSGTGEEMIKFWDETNRLGTVKK